MKDEVEDLEGGWQIKERGKNKEKNTKEVIIQPTLAEPLIIAINTGKWAITKIALRNLKDYYIKELNHDEVSTLKLLQTAALTNDKSIYEYTCHGGHLEIAQQLCKENISPEDESTIAECNRLLASKVQTSDENDTALSVTQLLSTTMEMLVRREKHTLAAQYYHIRHHYLFFLPASILTAASAALAFLSSSISNPSIQKILVIVVGIIATVSTFIQTLNDQLGLGGKADIHSTAAKTLDSILLQLNFAAVDIIKNGSSAFGAQQLEIVRKQATSIESSCSDPVPEFINSTYNTIMNEMEFHCSEGRKYDREFSDDIVVMQMEMKLISDITHEILVSWGWPWYFNMPRVIDTVREKMRRQVAITSDANDTKKLSFHKAVKLYLQKNSSPVSPEAPDASRPKPYLT